MNHLLSIRRLLGSISQILLPILIMVFLAGVIGPERTLASSQQFVTTTSTTIVLCASATATSTQLTKAATIVRRRVHRGFKFHNASIKLSGNNCITVKLPHTLKWRGWLAQDLGGTGKFGIGVRIPSADQRLTSGQHVRYKNDAVTSTNTKLPVVKVVIARPGFRGYTAKYQRRDGYDYVGVDLTPSGSKTLCTFTKAYTGKLAVAVLDRQVISDEKISAQICTGSILTGFPIEHTLVKPLGPREVIADLHSGPLPVPLSVTSVS